MIQNFQNQMGKKLKIFSSGVEFDSIFDMDLEKRLQLYKDGKNDSHALIKELREQGLNE